MPEILHPELPDPDPVVIPVDQLFQAGFEFTEDHLDQVRSFPIRVVEKDLLHLFEYGLANAQALFKMVEEEKLLARNLDFVPRSLFLMAELGATEMLGAVLQAINEGEEFERFVETDIEGGLWQAFYLLGRKEPELLAAFVRGKATVRIRAVAVDALGQLALHEPVWREQVAEWMVEVLRFHLEENSDDSLLPTHAVMVLRDLRADTALPLIEEVFEAGLCIPSLSGSLEELKKNIRASLLEFTKKKVLDMVTLFKRRKAYGTDSPFSPQNASSILNIPSGKPINPKKVNKKAIGTIRRKTTSKFGKVGRNETCPCGSGKKYKKCHGK
jgi:hypothetical protein